MSRRRPLHGNFPVRPATHANCMVAFLLLGISVLRASPLPETKAYYIRRPPSRVHVAKAISVFFAEVFKFVASVVLVCLQERSVVKGLAQIYDQFVHHWRDALKVLVPAVVYTIQNFLLYVAVENLPAATYMVTYQLKILTTAVFTVLVLGRKLSIQQWVSLFFLITVMVSFISFQDQKMSNDREKAERAAAAMATELATTAMPTIEDAFTKLMVRPLDMFS
ncbi:unnamed protein product [Heligmosomoides polygyrus]|uniref:UDP-galactose translocator n=1 Tax=Heligmosomoides polygyrus TaxID=6339 RepID=A0A3P8ABM7_HELPZ|nr:unnamed protein product [Heligmosomoides polygyrus]